MILTISYEAARLLQRSPSLARFSKATGDCVQRGVMVGGRWHCRLMATEARLLRSWCHAEADAVRAADPHAAKLLDGVAADITAALLTHPS